MRVDKLMTSPAQWCRPEDSLEHAAQLMWDNDCGCIPVCSSTSGAMHATSVVTDRDICMCALFKGKPLRDLSVCDAMANGLLACLPGDSVEAAERTMREAQIRRLPVVDEAHTLLGMISLADLAREAHREQSQSHREITARGICGTLALICEPSIRASPR
jgi:CBS domain-containing protein